VRRGLLGNLENFDFIGEPEQRCMLKDAVLVKSGACGDQLIKVARVITFINAFAAAVDRRPDDMWPMPRAVAALLISGEHRRATSAGRGSRGGATVGDDFCKVLIFMCDNLGFPVDLDGAVVAGAAPKAKEGGGRRSVAAMCSPRAYFLLEHLAATAGMLIVLCFYARSLLLAALNGIRLQDAERISFFADELDPSGIIRGRAPISKDGEPLNVYAPAQGPSGPILWLEEHLAAIRGLNNISFPCREGKRGSKSDISMTHKLLPQVASKDEIRAALHSIVSALPLGWSPAVRKSRF